MFLRWRAAAVLVLLLPAVAAAHAIGLDVKPAGETVRVEAYYDDDTPARGAKVWVEDESKAVIVEGRTDEHGVWTFPKLAPGRYAVRVDAGDGHAAKRPLTVGDDPSASLSDGPSRESFTGPRRWFLAGVGVAAIAGLTLLLRLARRSTASPA